MLTPENQVKPWINYEAGALISGVAPGRQVMPYLVGMKKSDVEAPLNLLQLADSGEEDTFAMVESLSYILAPDVSTDVVRFAFKGAWPELQAAIQAAEQEPPPDAPPPRSMEQRFETALLLLENTLGALPTTHLRPADAFLAMMSHKIESSFRAAGVKNAVIEVDDRAAGFQVWVRDVSHGSLAVIQQQVLRARLQPLARKPMVVYFADGHIWQFDRDMDEHDQRAREEQERRASGEGSDD